MNENTSLIKYFEGQPVIIINEQGGPFFRARDVAERLGYADPQNAIQNHVEDADKVFRQNVGKVGRPSTDINESGMYALILGSKKPEARRFKHWVTSDVLPSIRETGQYTAPGVGGFFSVTMIFTTESISFNDPLYVNW